MAVPMTGEQRKAIDDVIDFQSQMQNFWRMVKAYEYAVLQARKANKPETAPSQDMGELRRTLVRWSGRVRPLFERVVGRIVQPHPFYSGQSNAWDIALVGHEAFTQSVFVKLLIDHLDTLIGRLEADPSLLGNPQTRARRAAALPQAEAVVVQQQAADPRSVFIIHGHDELNLRRLQDLLKNEWHLETIVIRWKAGKGRTLIKKFEEEAEGAAYAFALLTPDDVVQADGEKYGQARPNVMFELGWFCGRLGRDKVCMLLKEGTRIHSDLEGVNRLQFVETVEERVIDLKRELVAACVLKQ